MGDDDTAPVPSKPNTVSFPSVREEDFGHYQCEVKDAAAGKVLLTLYTALYKEDTSQLLVDPIYHILSSVLSTYYITSVHSVYFLCPTMTTELLQLPNSIYHCELFYLESHFQFDLCPKKLKFYH